MELRAEILAYISKKRESNYYDLFRKFNDMDEYEQRNKDIMDVLDKLVNESLLEVVKHEAKIPTYRITDIGAVASAQQG